MIYLAGPIRMLPDRGQAAFTEGAARLRAAGLEVFNPLEHPTATDDEGIALGVRLIASPEVTEVVRLEQWEKSKGASLEVHVATELGKRVTDLDDRLLMEEEMYLDDLT